MTRSPDALRLLRTPKWIAFTLVVLLAAAVFAAASSWQYTRAMDQVNAQRAEQAAVAPVEELVPAAGSAVPDASLGRLAEVSGEYVADAWVVNRASPEGEPGYWLVSAVDDGSGTWTAVLRGWVPSDLPLADTGPITVTGRVHSDENFYAEVASPGDGLLVSITGAGLAEEWDRAVRPGYLVLTESDPSLTAADPVPVPPVFGAAPGGGFPLQNAAYALQWIIFIGFAGFMYVRWFRDDLARLREEAEGEPDRSLGLVGSGDAP